MSLLREQTEKFKDIDARVKRRDMVLLTGGSNGKTTLVHEALSVLARRDERISRSSSPLFYGAKRHPDEYDVEYIPRVYFGRQSSIQQIARQVLTFVGLEPHCRTGEMMKEFDLFLRNAADQGRIICLAVDNAELLPAPAYTILKALNEYYDPVKKRTVGTSVIVAGDATQKSYWRKMPESFRLRCTEVPIGKVDASSLKELIDAIYPGHAQYFGDDAIKRLMKCPSNLAKKNVIDRCIFDMKKYRLSGIGADVVEEKLSDLALAA